MLSVIINLVLYFIQFPFLFHFVLFSVSHECFFFSVSCGWPWIPWGLISYGPLIGRRRRDSCKFQSGNWELTSRLPPFSTARAAGPLSWGCPSISPGPRGSSRSGTQPLPRRGSRENAFRWGRTPLFYPRRCHRRGAQSCRTLMAGRKGNWPGVEEEAGLGSTKGARNPRGVRWKFLAFCACAGELFWTTLALSESIDKHKGTVTGWMTNNWICVCFW